MIKRNYIFLSFGFIMSNAACAFDATSVLEALKKNAFEFGDFLKESLHSERAREFAVSDGYPAFSLDEKLVEKREELSQQNPVEIQHVPEEINRPHVAFIEKEPERSKGFYPILRERKEKENLEKIHKEEKTEKQHEAQLADYATLKNLGIGSVAVGLCVLGWYLRK